MSDAAARDPDQKSDAAAWREDRPAPRVVQSDALFAGGSQLAIVHDRTIYILRKTRFGKLILTK